MLNEDALRAVVATVFEYLKADRKDYVMLSNEMAALRNALEELSEGKFQPLLEKHRKIIEERARAAGVGDSSDYDGIIHRVKIGQLF
jgi:hypothetical protein